MMPTAEGNYRMPSNGLHIWPRGNISLFCKNFNVVDDDVNR